MNDVDGGYKIGDTTYPLMKVVFHSPSNLPMRFFYTDGFFAEAPYMYNTHLTAASLCMAISGMYADYELNGDNKSTDGKAYGFSVSAKLVYDELIEYMKTQDTDALNVDDTLKAGKKFIFRIAGYSRAAAVSNLMAKRLADLCHGTDSKV